MTAPARPLALVTGSCRRLGAHLAARLGEAGYALALHSSGEATPDAALLARLEAAGAPYHWFAAELSDSAAVDGLVPAVAAHFGRPIDLLVNNASCFRADDAAMPGTGALVRHFAVNAAAPFALAAAVAAQAGPEGACVVNILDQRIVQPPADQLAYAVSKQALAEITRTLAHALAPAVRVNGVAPGLTLPTADYAPDQVARLAEMMPLGRLPEPNDIADAVLFLAGARATTGQLVFVDGGANLVRFERDFVHLGHGDA
ncbi:SDR family oxidoreductase [Sphingomonas sp. ac-8]|uniref:SDR family oxidoreductase n=1 Tax=Sphingomonas sp. ac-8 TaxID=3242977 RepID=UPI003A7F6BB8